MSKLKSVIFDTNEYATAPWLKQVHFDVPVSTIDLPYGDAWLSCEDAAVIVERKTPHDVLASIADGRLFNQCAKMAAASPWCYIVITGYWTVKGGNININYQQTQWNERSVQGALADCQELGVRIIYCENEADYGPTLVWLANRDRTDKHVKAVRKATVQTPQEAILCSLPNIKEVRAQALLAHHGNLAKSIVGLTKIETEDHAPGVGRGTRQAVRTVMGLADDEELFVSKGRLMRVEIDYDDTDGLDGMILADEVGFHSIVELAKAIGEAQKEVEDEQKGTDTKNS